MSSFIIIISADTVILAFDKASLNRIRNGIVEGHSVYRQALGIHCNLHLEK
jgi:hypothetical protein